MNDDREKRALLILHEAKFYMNHTPRIWLGKGVLAGMAKWPYWAVYNNSTWLPRYETAPENIDLSGCPWQLIQELINGQ